MIKNNQKNSGEIICDNCIKLEQRKKQLASSVLESQKEIKTSIKEYENQLESADSPDTKKAYYEKIKKQSEILTKSVELLKKIEETNNEKYIEEYKRLFEKMKKESS
ncbi:MAG: hypothetical protein KAT57_06055 [Candidatus Lokiarchaeota archaeon]|nr:hypothetical protein [Candidatus Lokiarchaeota archaeon]MCK4779728.1 hypothetical protein [Candidatus Lokiarchaeota archaeon]